MNGFIVDPYHTEDPDERANAQKLEAKHEGWARLVDAAKERYSRDPTPENEHSMRLSQALARAAALKAMTAWDAIAKKNVK